MDTLSTSAVAFGEHLGMVVDRMVNGGAGRVQLAIGPRPYPGDTLAFIQGHAENGVEFTAHANCPLDGRLLNQDRDLQQILAFCAQAGVDTYTLHAPRKRSLQTWQDFLTWAFNGWYAASEYGINFAVETMYPATSSYWLDSQDEVRRFVDWAMARGWHKPLATDVAHLQIGVVGGTWTEQQVELLLADDVSLEFHFSDNDGVHDNHRVYSPGVNDRIDRWVGLARRSGTDMIDEGRRR